MPTWRKSTKNRVNPVFRISRLQQITLCFESVRKKASGSKSKRAQMSEKQQNLQDTFLNAVRKNKAAVTIFLVNGVKLQGNITWFDNFCVLLRRDGQAQLVYKHAISTVMPLGPVPLQESETAPAMEAV